MSATVNRSEDQSSISRPDFSRRQFMGTAAATAAACTLPAWFVEECRGQQTAPARQNRDFRIALIGCGGRGRGVAAEAAKYGKVVGLCDVDEQQLAAAKTTWPEASHEKDFRKVVERDDIDVVVCGTVDHWHVLVSAAAMRAGKDVYCEKPLTLTIDEGKHLSRVQQQTKRILQTGSQQRSDRRFRLACELVRNSRVGRLEHIDVYLPAGRREGPFLPSSVPQGLDWDFWQGPMQAVPYVKERTHVTFRYWWDYSGGTMTDWGAHHNDIALWALGLERSGPVRVSGKSLVEMIPGGFSAASEYKVEYTYGNGVTHTCQSTNANAWNGAVVDKDGQQHGIRFSGSDGWIWVTRGDIQASDPEMLVNPLPGDATRLYVSDDHMGNFFDCVESRQPTICDAEIGHRSASVCHLGVIAMRLGRPLTWDPTAEQFDDPLANQWLRRDMRGPWALQS